MIKHLHIKTLLLGLYFLYGIQAYSQSSFFDNSSAGLNTNVGYNLPEHPFIYSNTEDYIHSLDVSFAKETVGKNIWEQLYNYPEYGLSLFYSTLGNDEVFGRELALTGFLNLYFLSKNRFRLYNHIGIGLSYVNRKFDFKDNYLNVAVGSKYNIHFNYRIGANYSLSDKIKFNTGVSFDHFSNANTSTPNLGINYLTACCGISHSIGKKSEKKIYEIKQHEKKNSYAIFASIGGKHAHYLSPVYFLTSSLSFELNRAVYRRIHFGIGSDFFYDSSLKISFVEVNEEFDNSGIFQTGIHVSQSLVYDKFRVSIQEGLYLYLSENKNNHVM